MRGSAQGYIGFVCNGVLLPTSFSTRPQDDNDEVKNRRSNRTHTLNNTLFPFPLHTPAVVRRDADLFNPHQYVSWQHPPLSMIAFRDSRPTVHAVPSHANTHITSQHAPRNDLQPCTHSIRSSRFADFAGVALPARAVRTPRARTTVRVAASSSQYKWLNKEPLALALGFGGWFLYVQKAATDLTLRVIALLFFLFFKFFFFVWGGVGGGGVNPPTLARS
jgi:hypothetical protein